MIVFNISMKKYCCACDQIVPDFYFFSYRPYGCPNCNSSPRERFVMYSFKNGLIPALSKGMHALHVAPSERNIKEYLRSTVDWIGGDINPNRYNNDVIYLDLVKMDIDNFFNLIYASHVLEHILDDQKAMQNIYNHLVPGGTAIILVPLLGEVTIEGGANLSPRERQKRFGQYDHVRQYGMDIIDRLKNVGFSVDIIDASNVAASKIEKYRFDTHGYMGNEEYDRILLCHRPIESSK